VIDPVFHQDFVYFIGIIINAPYPYSGEGKVSIDPEILKGARTDLKQFLDIRGFFSHFFEPNPDGLFSNF
jgi:hypothetical protein